MTGFPVTGLFRALDLTGVFANAAVGGEVARQEGLDPLGFVVLAVISGLGGGVVRDTLLQHGTPVALTDSSYLLTALGAAGIAFVIRPRGPIWMTVWPAIDALALGCWAVTGAEKTVALGLGWLPAVLLGTLTAVGGGATRDVLLRRVPTILGGNTLYATAAAAASAVWVVLYGSTGHRTLSSLAALFVGTGLCLLARWRGWILPRSEALTPRWLPPARSGAGQKAAPRTKGSHPEEGGDD